MTDTPDTHGAQATPATSATATSADPPAVRELRAGIYHFDGRVRCPFAGVGARGPFASNRLVVGGEAVVTVDLARNHVLVRDDRAYDGLTVLADLTFLADGITKDGRRIPFALHLKVQKQGREVSLDFHRHLRTQDKLVDAELDVYDVDVDDGAKVTRVLDRAKAMALIVDPPFKHKLIKALMAMRIAKLPKLPASKSLFFFDQDGNPTKIQTRQEKLDLKIAPRVDSEESLG